MGMEAVDSPLLTLFTTPKPFVGHIGVIQRNALTAWSKLGPGVKVIVFGEEQGAAEIAQELGFMHVPIIGRNRYGTPLLDSMFSQAELRSPTPYLCYINADIIVMDDFWKAFKAVLREKKWFLLVGKRWDFDLREPIDFASPWETTLREQVKEKGKAQRPTAIDYFVFARGMWGRLPAFAIGRTAWDNWLIYKARQLKIPVIDIGDMMTAVHQNHDYAHAGRSLHTKGYNWIWRGPEAKLNLAMAGGNKCLFTLWDCTHLLTAQGLVPWPQQRGLGGGIWSYRRSAEWLAG